MNKYLMGLVILCMIASVCYKKWATSYMLRKLYRLRAEGDGGRFVEAVDSDFVRFHFSDFTRAFMKLNFWVDREEHKKVEEMLPAFETMKCTPQERIALYSKLLGYTLERRQYEAAGDYQKKLEQLLKNRTDRKSVATRREVRQLERVYLKKDISAIPELEEELKGVSGETEAVICYRLAKLYYTKGEENRVAEYLQRACGCTVNEPAKRNLEQAMSDHSILM